MTREVTAAFDVEPHLGVLRRYALVLTRSADEAEDLVQEALVRAIAAARTWRPGRELRPWLLSILHNAHVSRRRRQQVEAAGARANSRWQPPATPPAQLDRVQLGQTMAALMTLPEEQREVLVLVALDGLSYKDVAEILGLPHRHRDVAAGRGPARRCGGPPAMAARRRAERPPCGW